MSLGLKGLKAFEVFGFVIKNSQINITISIYEQIFTEKVRVQTCSMHNWWDIFYCLGLMN